MTSGMRRALAVAITFLMVSSAGATLAAPQPANLYVPEVPADMSRVDMYLLTVGVGDELSARFGHTGLRILDRSNGTDVVFNWGKFSFSDPLFAWKFFRGALVYSMGVRTFKGELAFQAEDGRRVVQQALQLTSRQKRRLMEKVAWNAVPANRDFAYQYWFKNCATIPRDYLDEVLDGQVRVKYFAAATERRFRDFVRRNLAKVPFAVPVLDVLMNGNIDRPITAWEEMFLPETLAARLTAMPSIDDEGNPVPGTALLGPPEVLVDRPEFYEAPFDDYLAAIVPIWLPLLGALGLWASRRKTGETPSLAYRLLGLATLWWALVFGILGATLLLNWAFSGHPDGWHNPLLFVFWPMDLLAVPLGWRLLRSGAPVKDRWPFVGALRMAAIGHAACAALLIGLALAGLVTQDVWRPVAYAMPTTLFLLVTLWSVALRKREVPAQSVAARTSLAPRRIRGRAAVR